MTTKRCLSAENERLRKKNDEQLVQIQKLSHELEVYHEMALNHCRALAVHLEEKRAKEDCRARS